MDPGHIVIAALTNGADKTSKRLFFSARERSHILRTGRRKSIRNYIENDRRVKLKDKIKGIRYINKLESYYNDPNIPGHVYIKNFLSDMKSLLNYSFTIHDCLKCQMKYGKDLIALKLDKYTYNTIQRMVSMLFQIILETFYEEKILRKNKLHSIRSKLKWKQIVLQRITKVYGPPDKVVFVTGNYKRKVGHKGSKPGLGLGFLRMLADSGYDVYVINESYTSVKCSKCQNINAECYNFQPKELPKHVKMKLLNNPSRTIPKRYKRGGKFVHGLIKCCKCGTRFQRDVNGSNNIWIKVMNLINGIIDNNKYLQKKNNVQFN